MSIDNVIQVLRLNSDAAPGWVQAIGALLALGVAIWVPISQTKKARSDRMASILAVAEAAYKHSCNIREAIEASDFVQGVVSVRLYEVYDKTIIHGVVQALQAIPMHEIGSRDGVIAILSLIDQLVFLGSAVETFRAGPHNHPELARTLERFATGEVEQRKACYLTGFNVLAGNARQHLDRIGKDYEALIASTRRR